ncbi:MAG TPA: Clp protease ClpS [Prolixibacteraceae bacterium]|nr:Clp protease ClpS [Prolixibacteraceae bacterium]
MTSKETRRKPGNKEHQEVSNDNFLMLHNDDVHSFDYVTKVLIEVCDHSFEQASQCTLITHYKGKCDIKKGGYQTLKPLKDALSQRELNATID